jgi:site-specific recombinase XerD
MSEDGDRKKKLFSTLKSNDVIKTLLGLDENNKNAVFGNMSIPEEELVVFAGIMAEEMSKELTDEQTEYYCQYLQNENWSEVSKAHSKAISAAFIFMVYGKLKTDNRVEAYQEPEEAATMPANIRIEKDNLIYLEQEEYDPKKLN